MQQKRRNTQTRKQSVEQPALAKAREKATRAKPALGSRLQPSQDYMSGKPVPQQGQRQASYVKETSAASPPLEFRPCALVGPDGQSRPGWELWVNGMMFGRADSKETLLNYHMRLYEPLPSGHWKDRAWQPVKKRPAGKRSSEELESRFDDDEADTELAVDNSWNK